VQGLILRQGFIRVLEPLVASEKKVLKVPPTQSLALRGEEGDLGGRGSLDRDEQLAFMKAMLSILAKRDLSLPLAVQAGTDSASDADWPPDALLQVGDHWLTGHAPLDFSVRSLPEQRTAEVLVAKGEVSLRPIKGGPALLLKAGQQAMTPSAGRALILSESFRDPPPPEPIYKVEPTAPQVQTSTPPPPSLLAVAAHTGYFRYVESIELSAPEKFKGAIGALMRFQAQYLWPSKLTPSLAYQVVYAESLQRLKLQTLHMGMRYQWGRGPGTAVSGSTTAPKELGLRPFVGLGAVLGHATLRATQDDYQTVGSDLNGVELELGASRRLEDRWFLELTLTTAVTTNIGPNPFVGRYDNVLVGMSWEL